MLVIVCLAIGIAIAIVSPFTFSPLVSQYIALAILASLDSVFGGIASAINNNFKIKIFITGFFGNALLAVGLIYVGNLLNVDLSIAAIVVFGTRIFQNFAIIRRYLLGKYMKDEFTSKTL
jgi:small basic protein